MNARPPPKIIIAADARALAETAAKRMLDRSDDRFVPMDDPLSNMGMARRTFLDHVAAPAGNIHPMITDMTSHRFSGALL